MRKTLRESLVCILLGGAAISPAQAADTDEQSNIAFEEGSVHIYCTQPPNAKEEVFLEAFPKLIANLQIHADEGRVVRAHYLKELKHGVFVVVGGDTREDAIVNADLLLKEQQAILSAASESVGADSNDDVSDNTCRMFEVGPVAILPKG